MSYHNIPVSARQSTTNAQGQTAPDGYHYMPDGTLMADAAHIALYGSGEVIRTFDLDTTNIKSISETRKFTITGDGVFSLEIKNEDSYYYNFVTNKFQAARARLDNISISDSYTGSITFPAVSDADQYDFYLFAEQGTRHAKYVEVRFEDGSIDINSSTGSDSLLIKKVIYQTLVTSVIISATTPLNSSSVAAPGSVATKTITAHIGSNVGKIPFEVAVTAGSTHSYKIDRAPSANDIFISATRTIGSAPSNIPGEDLYPAISDTDTVDGDFSASGGLKFVMDNNVASNIVVGDKVTVETTLLTDTVDGAVSSGTRVVMDNNVITKMAVGDQITGNDKLDSSLVTVVELDPDGDNAKEFTMSVAHPLGDGITLTFTPKCNRELWTVAALNPDGDNVKEFSCEGESDNLGILDGTTLSFSNQMNYSWPIDNVDGLTAGVKPTGDVWATNGTSGSVISSYEEILTEMEGTIQERTIVKKRVEAVDKLGVKPTIARNATTKLLTTTQTGNITFNKQQKLVLAGDTIIFSGYGIPIIKALSGWDIEITDLAIALTKPTAVTTSAVSASASVPIDNADGIMDDVSTVSSINIDSSAVDPTVTTIGSYSGTTATLTLSAAQTLEDGETLTFDGAGRIITISGNIEIKKVGEITPGWNRYLYFDLEKFITATDES